MAVRDSYADSRPWFQEISGASALGEVFEESSASERQWLPRALVALLSDLGDDRKGDLGRRPAAEVEPDGRANRADALVGDARLPQHVGQQHRLAPAAEDTDVAGRRLHRREH